MAKPSPRKIRSRSYEWTRHIVRVSCCPTVERLDHRVWISVEHPGTGMQLGTTRTIPSSSWRYEVDIPVKNRLHCAVRALDQVLAVVVNLVLFTSLVDLHEEPA